MITNCSALYINAFAQPCRPRLGIFDVLGILVWLLGYSIETTADQQLKEHINDTNKKTKFCQTGFWYFSRHPNYFGEAVMWWGIWIASCSINKGWSTIVSPLFITWMLRYVSGVPFMEEKYKDNSEWQQYCKFPPLLLLVAPICLLAI